MTTMAWFGRVFDSPMYDDMPPADVADYLGKDCGFCREAILGGEPGITMPFLSSDGSERLPMHIECHLRSILGSPAHLDGLCACTSGEHEETGLTYRQEAQETIRRVWGEDWNARV